MSVIAIPTAKKAIEPIQLATSRWMKLKAGATNRYVPAAQLAATLARVTGVVVRQAMKTIATKYVTYGTWKSSSGLSAQRAAVAASVVAAAIPACFHGNGTMGCLPAQARRLPGVHASARRRPGPPVAVPERSARTGRTFP
jgi:hypothetical protein